MNQKKYNNYFDEEEERDFRRYKLDEDSQFESKLEAKNIIKAFIQTENDAEEIKSRAQNKKPQYWKEQKDSQTEKMAGYNTKLDQDIELALELINKRKEIPKKPPTTDDVVLNMELRHAKIKQMKEDRIKSKQEAEQARFTAQKARPPSANNLSRQSMRASGSLQSSGQKGSVNNDWDNSSQQSRPSTRQFQQSQQGFSNSRQTFQSQSQASLNNQLQNDSSITDLSQPNKSINPKNEIQALKNKRQNLEMQSRKMEEDMKQMKDNLRKELFQNNDASMISNRNGQSNVNDTIDYLQKEADESRMKYNQFRLQKLVKAYNFVLKRYKRLYFNQVFETLKQKNREYQRQEQQCVNIMRLKKLFVVFSNWKKYVYSQKDEKDVKFYLQEKIHENTFLNRAGEYYKRRLIRICMRHWKKYWKICKQEQKLDEEKNDLKYKIKGFISNLKNNIQNSEMEVQNQKEQQKRRVIEQFLKLNAAQNEEEQQIDEEQDDDYCEISQEQYKQNNNPPRNQQPQNQINPNKQQTLPNSKQNTGRNNLHSSMASQNSATSDNKPTRDNNNIDKSPNLIKNKTGSSNQDMKVTPQKKQNIQNNNNNNKPPIQQSPIQNNKNNKFNQNLQVSPESRQSLSNSKSNGRDQQEYGDVDEHEQFQQYNDHYEDEEDQSYDQGYDHQEEEYEQDENDHNYNGQESIVTDIARSRAPQPQEPEKTEQQLTFRQNQNQANLEKSPNQRQNSKGHNESRMSGQTNKDKEREENLKQIQKRTEDRKKKNEEFKKKHEELRKQKEEEKKKKEQEEIEKEREKRREEYENFQKKKREEKEKKEKAEKDKQDLANKLVLAKNHYQKSIAKYYGFKPWTKYIELQDHLIVVANQFNYMRILKNGLLWLAEATKISKNLFEQEMEFKEKQAKEHYHKTVLRKGLDLIKTFSEQSREDAEVYRQQRVDYLKRTVFYKWNDVLSVLRNENIAFEEQYKQIIVQFRRVVLQERAFRSWKQCSEEEKIERLKNIQKNELRNKANQWLNEFKSSSQNKGNNETGGEQQQQQLDANLSEQMRNSTYDDINKSQIRNEALKKYYNKKNKLTQEIENRDKKISEQPMQHEQSEDEEEQNYMNEQDDDQQEENEYYEDDFQQNENVNNYNHQYKNRKDEDESDEDGYKSLSQQHKNLRLINQNKNYDLPLVQVLQNTNELSEKLARNNSKSNKNFESK